MCRAKCHVADLMPQIVSGLRSEMSIPKCSAKRQKKKKLLFPRIQVKKPGRFQSLYGVFRELFYSFKVKKKTNKKTKNSLSLRGIQNLLREGPVTNIETKCPNLALAGGGLASSGHPARWGLHPPDRPTAFQAAVEDMKGQELGTGGQPVRGK